MKGLLRVIGAKDERNVDLPHGMVTIGSGPRDSVQVTGAEFGPSIVALDWDPRIASWVLRSTGSLVVPVAVNGHHVTQGEQVALNHLDTIELPGYYIQFQRLLDPPRVGHHAIERVALGDHPLTLGRGDPDQTGDAHRIDLDHGEASISRIHAVIEKQGRDFVLSDRSRHGMELNGVAFTSERLVFGDRFRISGYIFEFTGDAIRRIQPEYTGSVRAREVTVFAGGRNIVERVSLDIAAGEFIGVLGGSGQGKTTLLNALCGINPPTSGRVEIGGIPLADRARLREIGIGYVPQDDIVHRELTVTEAITYSARLRLRLPRHQIDALVFRVIARLGLAEHSQKRIANLSGGQRKRVSIAIELLAKPSVLFLDEPSSGLDPATEESLMTLLQSLTLTQLTVVCTTHVLQKAYLFDRILFVQGGRLVFAGNPDEARRHFLMHDSSEPQATLQHSPLERVYSLLASSHCTAADWETHFRGSPFATRAVPPIPERRGDNAERDAARLLKVGALRTFLLLAARQWRIVRSDWMNIAFLLLQPLLIGFLVGWVGDKSALRNFLCIVATMWFGCSNGAQVIVAELPIFRRERVCGQGMNAYILSKLGFLSLISLGQAALLLLTTLTAAHFLHPEKLDRENVLKELAARIVGPAKLDAFDQHQDKSFEVADADNPQPASTAAPVEERKPPVPSAFALRSLLAIGQYFQITQNILDSGPRPILSGDGTPLRGPDGRITLLPGTDIFTLLLVTLGLRILAIVAAALVGVSIGLTISSLVTNTTQAVLWVPLILIPQILFGGIVVTLPDMSRSVRAFSHLMPSFAAQRIMDVAAIYGLSTPFLTNRTKTPVFLTTRGEKETSEWKDTVNGQERSFSQDYDKISPVNTSWQNMAVRPERLGEHKQVGDRSDDGFRIEYRDTVEQRRDVRYSKSTTYRTLTAFQSALLILIAWAAACYATILLGLRGKQTGK